MTTLTVGCSHSSCPKGIDDNTHRRVFPQWLPQRSTGESCWPQWPHQWSGWASECPCTWPPPFWLLHRPAIGSLKYYNYRFRMWLWWGFVVVMVIIGDEGFCHIYFVIQATTPISSVHRHILYINMTLILIMLWAKGFGVWKSSFHMGMDLFTGTIRI